MSPSHDDDARAIPIRRRGGQPRPQGQDQPPADRTRVLPVTPPADRAQRPAQGPEHQRPPTYAHREPAPRSPAPPPPRPRQPRPARQPRRRFGFGRLLAFVIAAWLAFLVAAPLFAWFRMDRIDAAPDTRASASSGSTFLLVGNDGRGTLTPEERRRLGTGSTEGQRTDSIILVHIPSGDGPRALISIPRDSYLQIPGSGANKVNAAFAIGGAELLVQTLEQRTGLRIDGYAEIGFGGFANVVDSLDGVEICVPFDMDDPRAHINLQAGCQRLDGPTALGYVRARYSDPRGDLGRAERQRQFLGAIMDRAATPATVLVPWRWWNFTQSASGGMAIGENTSMLDMAQILLTMRGVSGGSTLSLQVPVASMNHQTSAGSAVLWDDAAADRLFEQIRTGQPLVAPS
ncbi:MAG: LCP family protein [Actinomycetia bacterium]|nr:LCP family protein [Actinomycetes bacterium]